MGIREKLKNRCKIAAIMAKFFLRVGGIFREIKKYIKTKIKKLI